jgi:protein phosphatase
MAARLISRSLNEALSVSGADGEGIITIIRQAFYTANSDLFESSRNRGMRMGTTASVVVCRGNNFFFAHVGDTRLVHITCAGDITQLSTDHRHGNCKNVLTNAIGIFPEIEVETGLVEMMPGESLLLSSDGLHDFFSQAQMKQAVAERSSLSEALHFMIRTALQDGSKDNVSGILLKLVGKDE